MRIISAIVFFCLLTPLGLVARVFGLNEIRLRPDDRKSYWVEREPGSEASRNFERDY